MKKNGLIQQVFSEANAYKGLEDLEALVEQSESLAHIPIQPLFMAIQLAPTELIAQALPKLSKRQRQAISDLSLWQRDKLDVEHFVGLVEAYAHCGDDQVMSEFAKGHDFLLFLKGRVHIHTFDAEEPEYPDNDYYFLTEDNLLLIEYDEDFEQVDEIKTLVKSIYSDLGVEYAYTLLFKYVADAFSIMEEESYQRKKSRLRDFGFIDYYEAFEYLGTFKTHKQIDKFLDKKSLPVPNLSNEQLSQALHSRSLVGYKSINLIEDELFKIKDDKRLQFLRFHLLRFINGTLTLNGALKSGRTNISDSNRKTESLFLLGYDYLIKRKQHPEISIFEVYDFFDCYKVGNSLVSIEQKSLKKALSESIFDEADYLEFLGDRLKKTIEAAYRVEHYPKNEEDFTTWRENLLFIKDILPFAQQFYKAFQELKLDGKLQDSFYYNYELSDIDLEALILSSFIHYSLDHYENSGAPKMGVLIDELIEFTKLMQTDSLEIKASGFAKQFGMQDIVGIEKYLLKISQDHLDGYEFESMSKDDFKHVGGPVILNTGSVHKADDE